MPLLIDVISGVVVFLDCDSLHAPLNFHTSCMEDKFRKLEIFENLLLRFQLNQGKCIEAKSQISSNSKMQLYMVEIDMSIPPPKLFSVC
jgi:hypothetical protein